MQKANMSSSFVNLCIVLLALHIVPIRTSQTEDPALPHQSVNNESLEEALKKFLDEWDRTHGPKGAPNASMQRNATLQNQTMSSHHSALPRVIPPIWAKHRQLHTDQLLSMFENVRGQSDISEDNDLRDSETHNCTRCVMHEEARSRRLESIKNDILNKLGFSSAPNITGKSLPRIPPLHHLLDRYGMMGDDPHAAGSGYLDEQEAHSSDNEDYEEFYVNAERSISFAQSRKLFYYFR